MAAELAKKELTYEVVNMDGKFIAVALPVREGRMPISKAHVTSSFCVELTCADGTIEVLGNPARPCPTAMIEALRNESSKGMLLVEIYEQDDPRAAGFEPGAPPVASEQMLRSILVKR